MEESPQEEFNVVIQSTSEYQSFKVLVPKELSSCNIDTRIAYSQGVLPEQVQTFSASVSIQKSRAVVKVEDDNKYEEDPK